MSPYIASVLRVRFSTGSADHDRDGVIAALAWRKRGLPEPVVPAVEIDPSFGVEQPPDERAGLFEAVRALAHGREVPAVGLVLADVPSRADAERDAAAGDDVDGGRHLGQERRVAVGVAGDEDAEPEPLRDRGHRRQQRPALERRVQFVLHDLGGAVQRGNEVVVGIDAGPAPGLHHIQYGLDSLPGRVFVDELRSEHSASPSVVAPDSMSR